MFYGRMRLRPCDFVPTPKVHHVLIFKVLKLLTLMSLMPVAGSPNEIVWNGVSTEDNSFLTLFHRISAEPITSMRHNVKQEIRTNHLTAVTIITRLTLTTEMV